MGEAQLLEVALGLGALALEVGLERLDLRLGSLFGLAGGERRLAPAGARPPAI